MSSSTITRHVSRAKAERMVAIGRFLGCTIALLTASIGYARAGRPGIDFAITGIWWIVAAAVALQALRRPHARPTPFLLALDIAFVAVLLMTTGGVTSLYFPVLVMPLAASQLLYGRKAILWTAAGGVTIYLLLVLITHSMSDPRLMLMRFGAVLLLALAVLSRSAYEERVHSDVEQLATWPQIVGGDRDAAVRTLLDRAAATLHASRAAAVWSESDGASYLAQLDGDSFELEEESLDAVVVPELERATSFLSPGLRSIDGAIEEWAGTSLAGALTERLAARTVLGARFLSQTVSGWLLVLDREDATADDLMLAEIVARLVSGGLDQVNLAATMRENATAAERMRVSRDLHDGLLQTLSGLALHVQSARRSIESDPRAATQRLETVVEQLAEGQRALRDFVDELRPEAATRRLLRPRLEQIARNIAAQWNVAVELQAGDRIDGLDGTLAAHVAAMVAEALSNAAKHGRAKRIRVKVDIENAGAAPALGLDVQDDGSGFPFRGRYDLSRLAAEQRGPWSLKERVIALGGDMVIDSSGQGSRVEVRLPLPAATG